MITYIARIPIAPEHHAEFEAMMTEVCAQVREHEPEGVPYYAFSRSVEEPDIFLIVEVYRDVASHTAHMESPWVTESLPRTLPMMSGKPDIRQYVSPGAEPVRRRYVE